MHLIFEFDIASIIISVLLIIFCLQKRQIATLQNRSYLAQLCGIAVASVLEIFMSVYFSQTSWRPLWFSWLLQCVFFSVTKSFGLIFAVYCIGLANILHQKSRAFRIVLNLAVSVPYIFALLIIWLAPVQGIFNPPAFAIDGSGVPVMALGTFWYNALYALSGIYIVFSMIFVLCHRKSVGTSKLIVLYLCAVLAFAAVIVQMRMPSVEIECFALSIASLIFFFYLQNPEELVDDQTRIFNRLAFVRVADRYFHQGKNFACVSVLIDDTVFLSRTFGFNQMSNFMSQVADFIRQNFSYTNSFRISQNCFTVIVRNPTESAVKEAVEKLQRRFQLNWFYDSIELRLYIRECVIECPKYAGTSGEIIDILDLVSTDERYMQPVVYANEADLEYKRHNDYIEHALRTGISKNRFDVYYQPIYSAQDKRIIGAEALIRLRDEKGRFLSPEDFIPIAERTGTILRIGEFVYEAVCLALSQINPEEYGIKMMGINLSVAQCMQEILADQIMAIHKIYQIPASIISLEITETAAAHSPEILLKNMERLAAAGFDFSLDDYGSTYANMNYMLNLPFKMIKIDKYSVWSALTDPRAKKALTATIQMIKSFGMKVLAAGVEDKAQAVMLTELGCDYLQGYYFSRPIQRAEFFELMKSQTENPQLSV